MGYLKGTTKTPPLQQTALKEQPVSLTVTIEAASLASGETSDEFPGLVPNERFFIASYIVVDEATGKQEREHEHTLRLKTDKPKSLMGRLGQPVKILGRWVHMGQLEGQARRNDSLPQALGLRPLKGQDLVDAAERQRAEFIRDAINSSSAAPPKSQAPVFFERSAIPTQARRLPPLFQVSKVVPLKGARFDPKSIPPAPR